MTKLDILGDLDELGEREIEYMPPPPKSNDENSFLLQHEVDV